jgi:hypothetical protein
MKLAMPSSRFGMAGVGCGNMAFFAGGYAPSKDWSESNADALDPSNSNASDYLNADQDKEISALIQTYTSDKEASCSVTNAIGERTAEKAACWDIPFLLSEPRYDLSAASFCELETPDPPYPDDCEAKVPCCGRGSLNSATKFCECYFPWACSDHKASCSRCLSRWKSSVAFSGGVVEAPRTAESKPMPAVSDVVDVLTLKDGGWETHTLTLPSKRSSHASLGWKSAQGSPALFVSGGIGNCEAPNELRPCGRHDIVQMDLSQKEDLHLNLERLSAPGSTIRWPSSLRVAGTTRTSST